MNQITGKTQPTSVLVGKTATRNSAQVTLPNVVAVPTEVPSGPALRSRQTGLIFQVLLGAAACLSLVAVVQQVNDEPTNNQSPSAPPPAIFVQTD